MRPVTICILEAWRQIVEGCRDENLGGAVAGAVQSSPLGSGQDSLAAIAKYCLTCDDPSQIAWLLKSTSVRKSISRIDRAALVLRHPSLLPYLARCLDQLPVFAVIRSQDLNSVPSLLWLLSNLSSESLTASFNDIMALLSRLLNSTQTEHKKTALAAFRIVLAQVDLPVLRWQSALILELLRREVQIRDGAYESVAVDVYVQALTRLLPRQRPRGDSLTAAIDMIRRELVYLALGGTYPSSNPDRPKAYLRALRQLVALAGTGSVVHLRAVVPALFALMESGEDEVKAEAVSVLQMLMRVCWPLMPSHCGKMFDGLCHAAVKHKIDGGSNDVLQRMIAALALLRRLCPERFNRIAGACEQVEIVSDLLRNLLECSQPIPSGHDYLLAWDNLNVYS